MTSILIRPRLLKLRPLIIIKQNKIKKENGNEFVIKLGSYI